MLSGPDNVLFTSASAHGIRLLAARRSSSHISASPAEEVAVLSNGATRSSVAGSSPFGMDMTKADGIKLWVSVDSVANISFEIGKRSNLDNYIFTTEPIYVANTGYIYIPFDKFTAMTDGTVMEKDGSMNYIRIIANTIGTVRFADLNAYNEVLENSTKTQYSETKITTRNQIVSNEIDNIVTEEENKLCPITNRGQIKKVHTVMQLNVWN